MLFPELLPYEVTVVGVDPPPGADHQHLLLLLLVRKLHPFGDCLFVLEGGGGGEGRDMGRV